MSRAEYKPDCGYGWIIVAACFSINFIMAGLVRVAGVLYVALIDVYGVSREVSTMPFSMRFCMRNMSGPLVGALGQRFGIRPVVLLGGLVCGLGGILSAFAPSVTWITFAWGGIHGLGYGMCNIIHVIVINRYFQKYKGLALGINYTGDCFGTFLLPLLLDFLLEMYNLNGTFLILGGISLHVVPAAMLLMPPPWELKDSNLKNSDLNQLNMKKKQGIVNNCFDSISEEDNPNRQNNCPRISVPIIIVSEQANYNTHHDHHQTSSIFENNDVLSSSKRTCMHFNDFYSNGKSQTQNLFLNDDLLLNEIHSLRNSTSLRVTGKSKQKKRLSCQINLNRKSSEISMSSNCSCPLGIEKFIAEKINKIHLSNPSGNHLQEPIEKGYLSARTECCGNQRGKIDSISNEMTRTSVLNDEESPRKSSFKPIPLYEEEVLHTLDRACEDTEGIKEIPNVHKVLPINPVLQFLRTNTKPMFLIISITMALFVFLFISIFTIIIDYAADNGVSNECGKYLIIAFSVTDAIGRVGFGIVIDRKWLSLHYYALLTTGIMGLCIFTFPLFKCFTFWIISFSVCGFVQGGTCIMFPVLIEHYMEKDEESVALGCLNFYGGLLMLPIPPMIGFFRDVLGSYDGVFWTVGALCMLAGSLWIFEPCIIRKMEKKTYEKNCITKEARISE